MQRRSAAAARNGHGNKTAAEDSPQNGVAHGGDYDDSKKSRRKASALSRVFAGAGGAKDLLLVALILLLAFKRSHLSAPKITNSASFWMPSFVKRDASKSGELCRSLWKTKGNEEYELEDRQHSPLIFDSTHEDEEDPPPPLVVCRTPKVGTAQLRCLQRSYQLGEEFEMKKNVECRPLYYGWNESYSELHDVEDPDEFNRYLYGDDVNRIMFVRHPVRRILSGFIQIARTKSEEMWQSYGFDDQGASPEAFRTFLFNSTFWTEYDPTCSPSSTGISMDSWSQHWAPPQQCRCGIWDCDVQWTVYKIEEEPIGKVMARYIPGPWVPKEEKDERGRNFHSKKYDEKKFLTPDVLKYLNELTRVEQEYFGYEPIVLD